VELISPGFLVFAAVAVLSFHGARTPRLRRCVLTVLNTAFLATFASRLEELIPLITFIAVSVACVLVVNRNKSRWVFATLLLLVIGAFAYLKRYAFLGFLPGLPLTYATVGLSYIVFRALHLLVDTYQESETRDDLQFGRLWNYLTGFLSLTAGPIQAYGEYCRQEEACTANPSVVTSDVAFASIARLVQGLFKLTLLCAFLQTAHHACRAVAGMPVYALAGAAVSHLAFVYVNFSGYIDVIIGTGQLIGFSPPENFNSPYLASNFLDLWNRWHITVSQWFKTYVFNPLLRLASVLFPHPALLPYFGVASYFVVFFLLGLWHGTNYLYVVLGAWLGLGVSVNKLWEIELRRLLGRARHQALITNLLYRSLARGLALAYFIMTALASWNFAGVGELAQFVRDVGWLKILASYGLLTGTIAGVTIILVVGSQAIQVSGTRVPATWMRISGRYALVSLQAACVLLFLLPAQTLPTDAGNASQAPPIKSTAVFYGRF
jgi:D-alanyl-lipoteichoic acid acyltransferase DltB (MBOAT superfamily)